ncbi:response regulator [Candidatus Magnetominusculus xianensis]|uniref:histidine kinase n=1 Tax=Candidatus Magnetominusculus xianensis TaxID=1748249 RepID=A0ABR5SDF4_9BACT|nr:response regulator [Candidatus Magnetominusculus xianensis]KWT79616.1 signal transduction histidine-protein kinase [Candidatus Magnetominusculus xianensis]MBF0403829.1 response regulator [Nitrospirota bacterium]
MKLRKYFENVPVSQRMTAFTSAVIVMLILTGFSDYPRLCALLGVSILILLSYLFTGSITRPLKLFQESIVELSKGKINSEIPLQSLENEFGEVARSLEALRQFAVEEAKKTWMNEHVTEIAHAIQRCATFADFGGELTSKLAPIMGLIYGAYYVSDSNCKELQWVGGYACGDTCTIRNYKWGEGIIGQAASDRRAMNLLFETSDTIISTQIGPGALNVSAIAVVPVIHRDEVIAVIELGTMGAFVEEQMMFLDSLLPIVAMNMEILSAGIETQQLLQKTQAQAQALSVSEQQLMARKDELEESRAVLAQIEERSRLILSSIKDGICLLDSQGIILYANNASAAMLGYTEEELIGEQMHAAIHYAHIDSTPYARTECHIHMTTRDGTSRSISDEVLWRKDGSYFHVEYTTTPIHKGDTLVGIVVVFRDITERIRGEMAVKKANFLADTALQLSKSGYWHVPLDGSGWYNLSERAVAIFGDIPNSDYRYRLKEDWLVHVEEGDEAAAKSTLENFNDAVAGNIPVFDSTYAYKRPIDGRVVWIRDVGIVKKNAQGKPTDMYGVNQDVTDFINAQEEIRRAKEIAEEATKMKSDFLANMSHEIRTPMNAIIGMTRLALQTELNSKQRNYMEKVDAAAKNLLGIINDILDFSKIEAGKLQFEQSSFYLEDVLEHIADLSTIKTQEKSLEFLFNIDIDVPTALVGDSLRLGQVLINLTNNAIKFTEKGEIIINISKEADGDEPNTVRLYFGVTDTGVGLTQEQQNKLFKAFSQADTSTTRKYGGTGLGLTISKRLVEMMDGQIAVKSEPGVGSTFYFTAKFGLQPTQRRLSAAAGDIHGLRVLVVDDNPSAREIFQSMLTALKFNATAVKSGTEAIEELMSAQRQGMSYRVVFMDWRMQGMDGIETIRRIRSDVKLADIPAFIMATAYSRDELMHQAKDIKIDGLLTKPVSPSTMLDSILTALGKQVVKDVKRSRRDDHHEAEKSMRGAYVLLVEDNEVNQELAIEILQDAGMRVDVAVNGLESLEKVKANKYDAVLMDCQMPVMDGFEATREIRKDDSFASLPVIAMTANAMAGDRERCIQAGMNDHIAKPIDVVQLFTTLALWIKPADAPDIKQQPKPHEDALPDIVGLDLKTALRRVGGNATLLKKLITRFTQTQADVIDRINAAAARADYETATREAHTVKGLAGNIGADEVFKAAATVEGLLKNTKTNELPEPLRTLEEALKVQLANISEAMPAPVEQSQTADSVPIDTAALAEEIQKFAAMLAEDDPGAAETAGGIMDKLTALGHGEAARQINTLISGFEFEDALEKLKEAAAAIGVEL